MPVSRFIIQFASICLQPEQDEIRAAFLYSQEEKAQCEVEAWGCLG